MVVDTTKCCKPSVLYDIPLVRGDCVDTLQWEVIVEVVLDLSSVRWSWLCGFEPYPSSVRLIFVWLSAYPSKCRGDLFCALSLSVEVVFVWERSCVLLVVLAQILSGGSLYGKSCVDDLVEILLCESGDVELGARTSKHIIVFAFNPLSLNSLLYCALHWFILSYHSYMLGCFCLCASLVFNHESFI